MTYSTRRCLKHCEMPFMEHGLVMRGRRRRNLPLADACIPVPPAISIWMVHGARNGSELS